MTLGSYNVKRKGTKGLGGVLNDEENEGDRGF